MTVGADADRHEYRLVARLVGPALLENQSVEVQIRELTDDLAISTRLNLPADLLIQS